MGETGLQEKFGDAADHALSPTNAVKEFFLGIDNTFHDHTDGGWEADAHKAKALGKINDFIDEHAPNLHLGQERTETLKTRIAELANQNNAPSEGEELFNIFDVRQALIETTETLGQSEVARASVQGAIDILLEESRFDPDMIVPLSTLIDHVTEAENKTFAPQQDEIQHQAIPAL